MCFQQHISRCTGKLNVSSGELACMKTLELLNIQYNREVSPIPNSKLRYDFQFTLNEETYYLEYDGRQHVKPVCFGGITWEEALENFNKQVKHDRIKNEWCEKNNCKLIRISYKQHEDIYSILSAVIGV